MECPECCGNGWISEHDNYCDPSHCPVQVQCEACLGTGRTLTNNLGRGEGWRNQKNTKLSATVGRLCT
jgi:DnaJ-class molecular chaperone